jgi:chitodextrinase
VSAGALTATAARNQLLSFRIFPASLPPAVKILPSDTRLTEAGDAGSFTVVRTGDTGAALDVPYVASGTATPGSDYEALSGTATIPAGATSTVVPLVPVADTATEVEETITVTLAAQPGYLLGLWRSAAAAIIADGGSSPPPGAGAVGLYPFSEGAGGSTADVSGNGNAGAITAAAWTTGKYGPGLQFNGSTSFVTIADAPSLDIGAAGAMEAWVRLDATNVWHGIVAKGSVNLLAAHNYGLEVTNGNRIECSVGNGASSNLVTSTVTLAKGTLYHLACTWGAQLQLYVNGTLNASSVRTITPSGNSAPLYIGQYGGNADRAHGLIDEVRISNRTLTQAEIQTDMSSPIAPPTPDTVNPTVTVTFPATETTVSGQVAVAANASDDVGVLGVQFKLDGANLGVEDATAPYAVNWDTLASANGVHVLSATARDAAGNSATAADVTVTVDNDRTAPSVPANLTAAVVSSSEIDLSWSASTDNVGVAGYRVVRDGTVIATTTATSFKNTGLAPQTTYSYTVAAYDAATNVSANSSPASATTSALPTGTGLVAAYRFGEGTGTTTADVSGNGNVGTLVNGAAWTTAGKYGGAINFDGVDDHVRVADSASLDLGSTGTVEAWVRLDRVNRWATVVAKGTTNTDPSHDYALQLANSGRWRCVLGNGVSAIALRSSAGPQANRYYHVACVWNGTTVQLYVDGALNVTAAQSLTPAVNAAPLYIGQFGGNADRLDGIVDEVRVYNRALPQVEIQNDLNSPL